MEAATAPGWRLEIHDSLPSTSDRCIERAEAGEAAGLAILARRQTRARGSRGRDWIEPEGNLALSVLLRPSADERQASAWPFVAALALLQALEGPALEGGVPAGPAPEGGRLRLKWPNDILLDGAKLAGILVERGLGGGQDWLVIGFGANLASAPAVAGRETACLARLRAPPSPEHLADGVLAGLDGWRATWGRQGFAAIRTAWLARAHPVGTALAVRRQGGQRVGVFAGLAADGALLLASDGQEERIGTGEILLLDAP